jgi:hypothetical protein
MVSDLGDHERLIGLVITDHVVIPLIVTQLED